MSLAAVFDFSLNHAMSLFWNVIPYVRTLKPFYVIAAGLFFYFTYVDLRHRRTPLSIVKLDVTLMLESPGGGRATLTRTQKLRANRDGVVGYRRTFEIDKGRLPVTQVRSHIDHCEVQEQRLQFAKVSERRLEFFHRFPPIPRKLYVLGLNTVTRTETIVIIEGYTNDREWYEMLIPEQYPHRSITINIQFHPERVPEFENCEATRINMNGVLDLALDPIPPSPSGTGGGIRLRVKRCVPNERYRIEWQFPPRQHAH